MTETVGKILENGIVEKEYHGQGCIYKNFEAFEKKTDEVCYVPELTDEDTVEEGYKYKDFVELAQSFIDENEDVKEYCEESKTSAEDIATELFQAVDWQHPSTLIDEWQNSGAYTE